MLAAYLNSSIAKFNFNEICNSSGTSTNQWKKFALDKLNVPNDLSNKQKNNLIDLVNSINQMKISDKNYSQIISKINNIFYEYYDFDDNEIKTIENHLN